MSADGDHLGWLIGSLDIILKGDHLRTMLTKFGPNWLSSVKGNFFNIFPIGFYIKTMQVDDSNLVWWAGYRI